MKAAKMLLGQITPIRKCNLRCNHCFITNAHKLKKEVMSFEDFKKSIDLIYDYGFSVPEIKEIEVVLMGGELHLINDDDLFDMIIYSYTKQIQNLGKGKELSTTIITNLIGIKGSKIEKIRDIVSYYQKEYGADSFVLATSYEPDTNRFRDIIHEEEWKRNVLFLTDKCKMAVGVTGTKGTVEMGAKDLIKYLTNLKLAPHYDHFASYGEGKNNDLMPDYYALCDFMYDFYSEMNKRGNTFFDYNKPYFFENLNSRWHSALAINFDGSISMDSESSADEQEGKLNELNIHNVKIKDIIKINTKRLISMYKDSDNKKCINCKHLSYCNGGFRHYIDLYKSDNKKCAGLKLFLDKINEKFWS